MYFGLIVILVKLLLLGGNKKIRGDAFWETAETRSTQLVSKLPRVEICFHKIQGLMRNNAITDGGVALPKFLLTIVMKLSNFKSLRLSRNS